VRAPVVVVATGLALTCCVSAAASSWPHAGGDASRSGAAAQAATLPLQSVWSTTAAAVVAAAPVVTDGAGPDAQRVAYATADGRVHVRVLATGAAVGDEEGVPVADGLRRFADGGLVAGTGQVYAVHDDVDGVEVARVDVATGARIGAGDVPVPGSLGCRASGPPVLTPPATDGSRILFFAVRGACAGAPGLLRWGIGADGALLGAPTAAAVDGLTDDAGPSLVVLRDPQGAPRFHVAVPHVGGIAFFDAGRDLTDVPDLAAALPAGERPGVVSAPATAAGVVAGASGSGTPPAEALYVAAASAGATRVHRLVQDGVSASLRVAASAGLPGRPAPGLAVAETMRPSGPASGGRVLAVTTSGAGVLRLPGLKLAGFAGTSGAGMAAPVASGALGLVARGGGDLLAMDLRRATATATGAAPGATAQPALARGLVLAATASGLVALRTTDAARPALTLRPLPRLRRGHRVTLRVHAADDRGIATVAFRLRRRTLGTARPAGFSDDAALAYRARVPRWHPGRYRLTVTATDGSGLTRSVRRTVRVRR
jgi:hypothetical protein